jgi:hypothetical protein
MEPNSWDAASSPSEFQGTKYSNPRGLLGDYRLPNYKIHDEKTALQWEFPHSPQIKIKHFTTMEPDSWDAASSPSEFQGTKYNNPRGLLGDYRLPNYKIHDEKTALQWEFPHSPQIKIKHFTTMEPNSWDAASSPSEFQGTTYNNPRGLLGATF